MVFIEYLLERFNYYEKPEGTDPVNKIMGLAKIGFLASGFMAVSDAFLYSRCTNAPQFLNTAAYWMIPTLGMCVTFSSVAYVATNLRKKDDHLNYVLGALASGAVMHAWVKDPMISGPVLACFLIYAVFKKHTKLYKSDIPALQNPLFMDTLPNRWYFPWRNVPYRDYTKQPRWGQDKEDYYIY